MEVRTLEANEYSKWDRFISQSPQGSIFCTTQWMSLFGNFWIYGCFKGNNLIGGLPYFEVNDGCFSGGARTPLTPFQGILIDEPKNISYPRLISLHNEVTEALINELEKEYDQIQIVNHYSFFDVRPFIWHEFSQFVRYSFVLDITDLDKVMAGMEKDTRYLIAKSEKEISVEQGTTKTFCKLYNSTFSRKNLTCPVSDSLIQNLTKTIPSQVYIGYQDKKPIAGVIMMTWENTAYYILGASEKNDIGASYATLWYAIQNIGTQEVDFVGGNDRHIGLFKRGFGGKLKSYLGCSRD